MPSAHGVIFNDRSLEWTANTHVRHFRDAGYRTGLLGKSHLQHGMSRNAIAHAPGRPAVGDPHPQGWDQLEDEERYLDGMPDWPDGATSPEVTRAAMAANYGSIEMIDDRVGQILAAVERLGQTDNTIVVFTSDHGDMIGDHGLLLKGFMHYRGTLQVPLVIADPRQSAGRTTSLASSIDLAPTLLDVCGVDPYHGIQGVSQVPVLDDAAASVRDSVLIEDDLDRPGSIRFPSTIRTLITATHRYSRYNSGEEGLYELHSEDDERTNLASTQPELRASCVEQLTDSLMAHSDKARGAPVLG